MKSIVRVFVLLWSLGALAGCGPAHDPITESEEPLKAKQVIEELDDFLSSGTEKAILLNRSQVRELLIALEQNKAIPVGMPTGDDPIAAIKIDQPAIRREKEGGAVLPGETGKEAKPVGLAIAPTQVPGKSATEPGGTKEADALAAIPVTSLATGMLPQPPVDAGTSPVIPTPVSGVSVPEGFKAEIVEPTTGAKFLWDRVHGWWRSDEFEAFLKGSKAQNDSFCWILTTNSQGSGASDVPEGWTFQALDNGKGIVIAPKGIDLSGAGETGVAVKNEAKAPERQASGPPVATASAVTDSASLPAAVVPVTPSIEKGTSLAADTPAPGASVPEGFKAEIIEPTTGAKFMWDRERGWWRSDGFETYLKGSKAQNDSFCWLLTTNSQSAGTSDIPEGWAFQAMGDGKSIVLSKNEAASNAASGNRVDSTKGVEVAKGVDVTKGAESVGAPPAVTGNIQGGQAGVTTRAEPMVATENRGVAATLPIDEPISEDRPPIPATSSGKGSEEPVSVPSMAIDPRIQQLKVEETREVPNRDDRSVMMPPGSALPDGRILYAPSDPVRQPPATRPLIFPIKGAKGAVPIEKSGADGKAMNEGNTVPGTPQGTVPGNPESGAAPKPRPKSLFFKSKKAQAIEEIPVEPKPSVTNSQDL